MYDIIEFMDIVVGVIVGLLVLMFLVSAHEFGHFLAARRNGVSVLEFGIGFPPRAIAWIKDKKTGKWRRLPKSEWVQDKLTKVVYSESKDTAEEDAEGKSRAEGRKKAELEAEASGKTGERGRKAGEGGEKGKKDAKMGWRARRKLNRAELKRDGFFQRGMIFSLNWLPIGGFCQMDGESDAETRPGTLGAASFWSKTKVLFAGVGMNWLVAIVILTILAWVGMPEFVDNQFVIAADARVAWTPVRVGKVMEDSPAARAGMQVDDYVVAAKGVNDELAVQDNLVESAEDIKAFNSERAGQKVIYTVVRGADEACMRKVDWDASWDETWEARWRKSLAEVCGGAGEAEDLTVQLNAAEAEYLLGISMQESSKTTRATWSAPLVGVGLTAQLTGQTFQGVGTMIWNLVTGVGSQLSPDATVRQDGREAISEVGDSVSGPVGIIGVLFPAFTAAGPVSLAFLTALISVSLACMNVLPIPALDGGRWFLIALYKLRKKELTKETEEKIVSRAFIVLLALIFIVTVLDIMRIAR